MIIIAAVNMHDHDFIYCLKIDALERFMLQILMFKFLHGHFYYILNMTSIRVLCEVYMALMQHTCIEDVRSHSSLCLQM